MFTPVCDSVHRGCLCPRRVVSVFVQEGGLCPGVSVQGDPHTVEERTERMRLEYILV